MAGPHPWIIHPITSFYIFQKGLAQPTMDLNLVSATPTQAVKILKAAYLNEETVMIHGTRGIGKSSIIKQFAVDVVKGPLYDIRLTQIEPCDLRGLPMLDAATKTTRWFTPEFLPTADTLRALGVEGGVIFLDELNAADHRLQKSAYQLLLDRKVGDYAVPRGVFLCAAGNTGADGAVIHQIDAPAADRMVHIRLEPSVPDWTAWAQDNALATEVIAYVKSRPEHLDGTHEQLEGDKMLGPSPRAWNRVSRFIKSGTDRAVLELVVSGILGEAVAASFMIVFDEIASQADIYRILEAKTLSARLALLPKTLPSLYNLAYSLAAYADGKTTLEQACLVAMELNKLNAPNVPVNEIQTLACELLLEKADKTKLLKHIVNTDMYKEYVAERKKRGLVS